MDKRGFGKSVQLVTQRINAYHGIVWNYAIQNKQRADPAIKEKKDKRC